MSPLNLEPNRDLQAIKSLMRRILIISLVLLGQAPLQAHSLQGTFSHQWAWTYNRVVYASTGTTEFTNLPDGHVIATSRNTNGTLYSIQNFSPSGLYAAISYDDYYGEAQWTGTWAQKNKRVFIRCSTTAGHRGDITWTLRNGAIRMTGSHFYIKKRIGRGSGLLRPL